MAESVRRDIFYVFVAGQDGEEHCLPHSGNPGTDTVRNLRRSIQVRSYIFSNSAFESMLRLKNLWVFPIVAKAMCYLRSGVEESNGIVHFVLQSLQNFSILVIQC